MSIWRRMLKKLVEVPREDARATAKTRLALPFTLGTAAFLMVGMQLVVLSFADAKVPLRLSQQEATTERGKIYDRQGRVLATWVNGVPVFEA